MTEHGSEAGPRGDGLGAGSRGWARAGLVAQVAFVLGWLVAPVWQPRGYSVLRHSVSDMYARTAPHGWVLVVLLSLCGATTIGFAWASVRPALSPAGRRATVAAVLLSVSVYGVGDLLTPFERLACQQVDPGCTPAAQVSNLGGTLDGLLTTVGVLVMAAGGFVLAGAVKRVPVLASRARPIRVLTVVFVVAFVATGFLGAVSGLGGLFERLLAFVGALIVALLALWLLRTPRSA